MKELKLNPHTHEHLSRVLLPVEYRTPKYEINNETIFEDIEKNLKDTLFWKSLKASMTVDDKFREDDFETVLETIASTIIKRHIDEKAFMFLGSSENGKSVFMGYIESILGKENISSITLQDIVEDKFYQVDSSLRRKHEGVGFGLAVCKGIVVGLGGKIGVDSTLGGRLFFILVCQTR